MFSRSPPCLFQSSRASESWPSVVASARRSIVGHHDEAEAGASMFLSCRSVNADVIIAVVDFSAAMMVVMVDVVTSRDDA